MVCTSISACDRRHVVSWLQFTYVDLAVKCVIVAECKQWACFETPPALVAVSRIHRIVMLSQSHIAAWLDVLHCTISAMWLGGSVLLFRPLLTISSWWRFGWLVFRIFDDAVPFARRRFRGSSSAGALGFVYFWDRQCVGGLFSDMWIN